MTAMGDSPGVGILGAGFMGQTYARTVATLVRGARLVAVTGGSRAPQLAAEYGITAEVNVEALLARGDVDIVCVATPHAQHGPQGMAAARAGKHLLIDKPMATTVEACDAILAECAARGLRCEITYTQRERICNVEMKRLLDSGELGRILHLHNVQVVPNGMKTTPQWQLEPENVGILMGHGIHNLDQVRWLTGREVMKVFAKVRACDPQYVVDSTADVVLTLDDGTVCTVFCSFEVPAPGIPRTGGATQVVCEHGVIDADWYGELRVAREGGAWEVLAKQPAIDWAGKGFLDPVRLETYAKTLQRLVDDVRAGKGAGGTGWDGRPAVFEHICREGVIGAWGRWKEWEEWEEWDKRTRQ
ncbi:MAG: Gfo/Idh/MocA family oxidoreductase [Candidatus Hydrogenedentes bacterium]|nr:Gfo/Idh/MocA family oxidoreductase [Candidatus Hydrogenedentota bacterium]